MKKYRVLLLCVILLMTNCIGIGFNINAEELSLDYIEITKKIQLNDIEHSVLNNLDAIIISDELSADSKAQLNEIMDNGTGIIVKNSNIDDVSDYFNVESVATYKNQMGCYVCKDGEETKIIPIECNILITEDDKDEVTYDDYTNLLKSETIDYDQVISDYNILTNTDKLNNIEDTILATLQGSTSIGSAFIDNDKFVYFYKKGSANGTGTTYQYSQKSSISDWTKMGSLSFSVYAIKIKTLENVTYDNIFSVTIATAYQDKYVKEFRNGISVTESTKNKIIDYTEPNGNANASVSGSVGTGVDSSGNLTSTYTTSYSYNPNGMDITTTLFSSRVRWTCEPLSNKDNASWKINPGILLKKTDGKTNAVTAKSYVSYFKLSGGIRTYTIEDTISCGITFKNHEKS